MRYVILVGGEATSAEREAAKVAAERIRRRTGVAVDVATEGSPAEGEIVVTAGTPTSSRRIAAAVADGSISLPDDLGPEGYVLSLGPDGGFVASLGERGVLYGLGRMLRTSTFRADSWSLPSVDESASPVLLERTIYFATHLGNWLVHCSVEELTEQVEDLALWGANEVLTWFDTAELASIDADPAAWDRLREVDEAGKRLGLRVGRVVIVNEGYKGQAPAELRTKNVNHRHSPLTDICPSEPEGKAMILANRHEYFSALSHLDRVWLWPYDHGGCNCEGCAPWPKTFIDLGVEVAEIARAHHPNVDVGISAWWIDLWHANEKRPFFDNLPKAAGWSDAVLWSERESTQWGHGDLVPEPFRFVFFPEIAMFDSANKMGIPWGGKGANPSPRRFQRQFADHAPWMTGFVTYSEGRYDDINKVVWTQLAWDPDADLTGILEDYARYELGADPTAAAKLILDIEPVLLGRATDAGLDERAARIEASMPTWGVEGWRWEMLRLNTRMHALRERLKDSRLAQGERDALRRELREHYEHLEFDLYLHRPGVTRVPNLYIPFESLADDFSQRRTVGAIPIEDELFPPLLAPAIEAKARPQRNEFGDDNE